MICPASKIGRLLSTFIPCLFPSLHGRESILLEGTLFKGPDSNANCLSVSLSLSFLVNPQLSELGHAGYVSS
jgi:hypothetical protein